MAHSASAAADATAQALTRRDKLLGGLDLAALRGAEVGALDKPLVPRSAGSILYIDHLDTAALRQKYADDAGVRTEAIEVDVVWGEKTLAQAVFGDTPPAPDGRLHYLLASHVIEHVPDFVGWLVEVKAVLQPAGELRLAIPDCRFTFDILRRQSNLADVLAAFIQGDRVPSVRAVLDHCLDAVEVDPVQAWAGTLQPEQLLPRRSFSFARCLEAARDRHDNMGYYPVHCWTFTPRSLAGICAELSRHGLLDFGCARWHDTARNDMEFFVTMRVEADEAARTASWTAMVSGVRNQG